MFFPRPIVALVIACLVTFSIFPLFSDESLPPTEEEMTKAIRSCQEQRIGDPAFRFPYNMPCDQWVKIKVGDNEYTRQYLADHAGKEELGEKEE